MHPTNELPSAGVGRRTFLLAGLAPGAALAGVWPGRGRAKLCGVEFQVLKRGRSDRRYLVIHGDEETARQTLLQHMRGHEGLAHLVTGTKRNVLVAGGMLDPNRMFTRVGAERSYRRLNPEWNNAQMQQALAWLDDRREKMLERLLPARGARLVALHNNSRGYSVKSELENSEQTSLPRFVEEPHNFFLCTAQADFENLCQTPYNVVLQKGTLGEEDGSLSRLCAARGLRYVNLEVEMGNAAKQREMLEALERLA